MIDNLFNLLSGFQIRVQRYKKFHNYATFGEYFFVFYEKSAFFGNPIYQRPHTYTQKSADFAIAHLRTRAFELTHLVK